MLTTINFRSQPLLLTGALAALFSVTSCNDLTKIEPVLDPNNAIIESVLTNASQAQINALAVGLEASLRLGHVNNSSNNRVLGTLGREVTVQAATESRWYYELQGRRGATQVPVNVLDDAAFYNGQYTDFARVGRAARVFRASAAGSSVLDAAQKRGVDGFTRTYEALSKLHLLNLQGENGIRVGLDGVTVDELLKPGKFVGSPEALTNIRQQLDQANTDLAAAGAAFGFPLSGGFAGFNTPATFIRFNRALAARVSLYQGDFAGTLTALNASFYDRAGSLTLGPKMIFSPTTANDVGNPYFQATNALLSSLVSVPDNFVTEAEPGDRRLAKAPRRTTPQVVGAITGTYEAQVFPSQTSPLDIIRNEELILIAAEARVGTNDLAGSLLDINAIRTRAGDLAVLPAASLSGAAAYRDEILAQRRYSLFYEGHYLVDLRRLNKLSAPPVVSPAIGARPAQTLAYSTTPYRLFPNLQRPAAEKAWDIANP